MTLEEYAEKRMDQLDRRFMKGEYTQEEYDKKVKEIDSDYLLLQKRMNWRSAQ